ncbi:hypothetical protein TNCV_126051 [Trichonephila clavipes]|nr:hypothetical protein TNCV_126051 [Trichonephila clavipes]
METLEMLSKVYGESTMARSKKVENVTRLSECVKEIVKKHLNSSFRHHTFRSQRLTECIRRNSPNLPLTCVYPHYSPDLASRDICPFPSLKTHVQGRRFVSSDEVIDTSQEALQVVAKNDFHLGFQKLYECLQKCIIAQEDYFECG